MCRPPRWPPLPTCWYRTGYDSNYLDEQSRKALLMPVLGDSDGVKGGERSGGVSPVGGRVERPCQGLRSTSVHHW